MHIVIATCGSRGDQQPALSLARCLHRRGHEVTLGGPEELRISTARLGLRFAETSVSMQALMRTPGAVTGRPSEVQLERVRTFLRDNLELQLRALTALGAGADILLGTSLVHGGSSVANALSKPFLRVHFSPNALPSGSYSPPGYPEDEDLDTRTRSWAEYGRRFDELLLGRLNQYRREHGLFETAGLLSLGSAEEVLLACDQALAPAPIRSTPLTPHHVAQTGAWQGSQTGTLHPDLLRWLALLPRRPLYAGFGSVPSADWPELVASLIVSCHELARPLLLCGHDPGMAAEVRRRLGQAVESWSQAHVRVVQEVPHAQLFPRCWAVLHHGGAGTVASAARAGVPQIVMPQARGSDQRMWSSRIERLGIGLGARSDGCLEQPELQALLAEVDREHSGMAARAARIQRTLAAADTPARPEELAADAIEAAVARADLARGARETSDASH